MLLVLTLAVCVCISAAQSNQKNSMRKSTVVTYQSDGPEKGMYKWGTFYLKINREVKLFYWGDRTRFHKSIYNSPNAYKKGSEWRIIYSVSSDPDSEANFYLLSATFTGRVLK